MPFDRRAFLKTTGLSVAGTALARRAAGKVDPEVGDWAWVRSQFDVSPDYAHFASFFIVSHPRPVREAIEALRREIDANPFLVVEHGLFEKPDEVRAAAAGYLGGEGDQIALTRSTTEGLAMIYAGLTLPEGGEILTTTHDHYSHLESIRLAAARNGARVRQATLYDHGSTATLDQSVSRLRAAIRPETRVVGVTWVHSSTGVKLPIRALADVVAEANRSRDEADRILLVVDGVHGLGVEDETVADMGCDFFSAGTHKWIFGPRGTGIVWGRKDAWPRLQPTVPSFELGPYEAWLAGEDPGPTRGPWMSPGGFSAYEHVWAVPAAFRFHQEIGRARIARRIHELNTRIKDGLAGMSHVNLHTPRDSGMSSGVVVFEVNGLTTEEVVRRLHERRILASASPYAPAYPRLAGSLLNTPEEVDGALAAVAEIA